MSVTWQGTRQYFAWRKKKTGTRDPVDGRTRRRAKRLTNPILKWPSLALRLKPMRNKMITYWVCPAKRK